MGKARSSTPSRGASPQDPGAASAPAGARKALFGLVVGVSVLAVAVVVFTDLGSSWPRGDRRPVALLEVDAGWARGPAPAADRPFRVGVLYWSSRIEGQVAMRRGLEAEAAVINRSRRGPGVTLVPHVAGDGEAGRQNQIEQMRALVRDEVDAIIVQPTDNAALVGPLAQANAAQIPVVAYDQYIEGGHLHAYITSDNRGAGTLDGEYVAHRFPDDRTLGIVLVEYPHVSSTVERLDGFIAALKSRGQPFEILASYKAVEPVDGRAAGQAILRDFPARGSVDVVFTVNDGGGLAVVEVLAAAGRDEIAVATIDGDPASVENIRRGRLTIIDAAQFCGPMGAAAMRAAYGVLMGEPVAPRQLISTFPITAETLDAYPGWMGPLPEAFTKPWPSEDPEWRPRAEVLGP